MQKLINRLDDVLSETLHGLVAAHADILGLGAGYQFESRRAATPGKVALIWQRFRARAAACRLRLNDDVAVENSAHSTGRPGVAGTLIVEKMVRAAAERDADLQACKALGDAVNRATASSNTFRDRFRRRVLSALG